MKLLSSSSVAAVVVALLAASSSSSSPLAAFAFFVPKHTAPFLSKQPTRSELVGLTLQQERSDTYNDAAAVGSKSKFSLGNLFSATTTGDAGSSSLRGSSTTTTTKHPSVRPHISPLNRMLPDNNNNNKPTTTTGEEEQPLPVHPDVKSGVLPNGLPYVILPNKSPPGRFEAHLQVFSGSADELEPQQGIAHLTEHVAYMGSRKRERLFGTGSQTNAYTDFHHTVFYAACPVKTPSSSSQQQQPMLPMALDALVDVMEARVEPARLEKERAAVLSEMTMVNTIEYRVECQILSTLHRENRLAKRFPIGKESLIKSWQGQDVRTWHRTHYRPDNVLLYLVGDIDPTEAEQVIAQKFGHLSADKQALDISPTIQPEASQLADAVVAGTVKAAQSWHYPPVRHDWSIPQQQTGGIQKVNPDLMIQPTVEIDYDIHLQNSYPLDDENTGAKKTKTDIEVAPGKTIRPHLFRHELLQAFSLHVFAKRPVEPVVDLPSFRKSLARRVALAALQIRLNVGGRSDKPAFTFVEFNQLDSAREGCAVCSLDMTAEPHKWKEAIVKAISEVRKLGEYGVTAGELERYASSLMTDAEQLAAQGDRISHGDQLSYLMETVANGHVFMSPMQSYQMTAQALSTLTLEQVNEAAAELCSHVCSFHESADPIQGPCIAIACCPKGISPNQDDSYCDEASLVQTIYDACQVPVEPEQDVVVPHTLILPQQVQDALVEHSPTWLGGRFTDGTPDTSANSMTRPFTLRRFLNGIRIGVAAVPAESQRGHLRITAPGGRDAERAMTLLPVGSMAIGARTMQEGGAFGPWSRTQVELFCVDHLLMVEINCNEEALTFDFVFPTTPVGGTINGSTQGMTGTESVLQIVREIIMGFKWEEDALGRSKQSFKSSHEGMLKNLENLSTERVAESMTNRDARFLSIDVDAVNAITLEQAKQACMSQLTPDNLEISIAGDFDVQQVLELLYQYVGTIPKDTNAEYVMDNNDEKPEWTGRVPLPSTPAQHLELELPDSDPRAVAYVAGAAPNAWGYLADGSTVAEKVLEKDHRRMSDYDRRRRSHPLFAYCALQLLAEIVNRRLFSTVRERKQLTYDANFSFSNFERLLGGWFLVTVTASRQKAQAALEACQETLFALRKSSPITPDNVESAKRVVLNRHEGELRTTAAYWTTSLMAGLQLESIPLKGPLSVTDYQAVVESITSRDLQLTLEAALDLDNLYTAIGRTVKPKNDNENDDDDQLLTRQAPVIGMRRGGALTG